MIGPFQNGVLSVVAVWMLVYAVVAQAETVLVRGRRAECAIVVDPSSGDFCRFAGQEIQRYVGAVAEAYPAIVTPAEVPSLPKQQALILVGGPAANLLVREAMTAKQANFEGLKKDGFVLRSIRLRGRPAVIVGGNDEASTMYAAYDLIERLGVVFLLSKDIIPERKADLAVSSLDVRSETPFSRRGIFISTTPTDHPSAVNGLH